MLRVGRLVFTLVLLVICALLSAARPAHATFHSMSISELGAGFLADPNVQFVEFRLDAPDQTNLTNTRLTSFDKDGIPTLLLLTPNGVANGTNGRNVLYATADFQTKSGITPDFVIPIGVVGPSGMICWGAPGTDPPAPSSWDFEKPENYVDCVAYGSYPHTTRPNSGTPTSLAPGDGSKSLTRTKNNSVTGSNATDFEFAVASPCNNAGQCAVLTVPTPTATASPIPGATPSKAQTTCRRTVIRAANKFAAAYLQALGGCEAQRLKGKLAGPCPDAKTAGKIAAADAKRTKAIVKACGALTPAEAGFGATCPGYTGACGNAIAAAADVSTCVGCGGGRAGDELAATLYAAAPDAALLKCQVGFGKTVTRYYRATAALLAKCEDGIARGRLTAPCPDAKTATKLAAKSSKLRRTLCRACGGKDRLCDGTADAAPAALGIGSCPARTVPGGAACGGITIVELADVATCVDCVTTFESTCTTALAAHPATLPVACDPAP